MTKRDFKDVRKYPENSQKQQIWFYLQSVIRGAVMNFLSKSGEVLRSDLFHLFNYDFTIHLMESNHFVFPCSNSFCNPFWQAYPSFRVPFSTYVIHQTIMAPGGSCDI